MKHIYLLFFFLGIIFAPLLAQNTKDLLGKSVSNVQNGNTEMAITYAQKAKEQAAKEFGTQGVDYIRVEKHLADLYVADEQYEKATTLYLDLANLCAKVIGKKSVDYVIMLNQLAFLYKEQKMYVKAKAYYLEMLPLCKSVFTSKYPEYAQTLNNLAILYHENGELDAAEPLYKEARDIVEKLYGTEHPDYVTLTQSLINLENNRTEGNYEANTQQGECGVSFANIPQNYYQAFQKFATTLTYQGSAPLTGGKLIEAYDFEIITYNSEGMSMQAYLRKGEANNNTPKPAIAYFHGGWGVGKGDLKDCMPFIEAGFVVFAPSFRGENGNQGNYEYLFGELRDAKAAVRWLAEQPYVDKSRIYTFGHSMGGSISLSLSLHPDLPIRLSGGSAGLSDGCELVQWKQSEPEKAPPVDISNDMERIIRGNGWFLDQMQRSHYLYQGRNDYAAETQNFINKNYTENGRNTKLIFKEVEGDHFESLYPAILEFLKVIAPNFTPTPNFCLPERVNEPKVSWLKDFSKAPQIALMNEAYMKGKKSMIGASSFLITYKGKSYGVTAKHLIEESGSGYRPSIKPSELNTVCASWQMYPRTVERNFIKMGKLLTTNDEMKEDILIFSIEDSSASTLKGLNVRTSLQPPVDVWIVGCPYSEEDCKQNLYKASVYTTSNGVIVAENVQPQVDMRGFSGAPVLDENGDIVGVLTGCGDEKYIFITPLIKLLQKTVGE